MHQLHWNNASLKFLQQRSSGKPAVCHIWQLRYHYHTCANFQLTQMTFVVYNSVCYIRVIYAYKYILDIVCGVLQ